MPPYVRRSRRISAALPWLYLKGISAGDMRAALAALVRKPLVHAALRLMRGPAKFAGLAELHQFLEDGYAAFHGMGDPAEFLDTIAAREHIILRQLFDGAPRPFEIPPA